MSLLVLGVKGKNGGMSSTARRGLAGPPYCKEAEDHCQAETKHRAQS